MNPLCGNAMIIWLLGFGWLSSSCGAYLHAKSAQPARRLQKEHALQYSPRYDEDVLIHRLNEMRRIILEKELSRPPNPQLGPIQFVNAVLESLQDPDDPLPDSGLRLLLRSSTQSWRGKLRQSIGASSHVEEDVVASALGAALSRPGNQFGILMGSEDRYVPTYPSDALDFQDGTCWVECRLRSRDGDNLLVIIGWQLQQGKDGAWMIDGIDWQDFRDAYRPGIGREEWMRICG